MGALQVPQSSTEDMTERNSAGLQDNEISVTIPCSYSGNSRGPRFRPRSHGSLNLRYIVVLGSLTNECRSVADSQYWRGVTFSIRESLLAVGKVEQANPWLI
jgi:hypothetical protein